MKTRGRNRAATRGLGETGGRYSCDSGGGGGTSATGCPIAHWNSSLHSSKVILLGFLPQGAREPSLCQ